MPILCKVLHNNSYSILDNYHMSGLDHFLPFSIISKRNTQNNMDKCKNVTTHQNKTKNTCHSINVWVYFYELFKTGESTKTESGLVVAWGWAGEGWAWLAANGYKISLGDDDSVQNIRLRWRDWWHTVNILKAIEPCILNVWMPWCVNYLLLSNSFCHLMNSKSPHKTATHFVKRASD